MSAPGERRKNADFHDGPAPEAVEAYQRELYTIPISGDHRQVDTPSWDTKVRCSCGAEFVSRAEFYRHQAPALQAEIERLRSRLAAAERVCEALDVAVESLPHIHGAIASTVDDVRAEANAVLDAVVPPLDGWRAVRDGDQ